ncbi:MAG: ABC transporter permease [Desulfovibrionales bacterium]|nr:ABC transporter permease [Desulfovibrionales bacterium]
MQQQSGIQTTPVAALGRSAIDFVHSLGGITLFLLEGLRLIISPKQLPKVIRQMFFIGSKSLFVISLIGIFTGMVLGLQGYYMLIKFGSEGMLGTAISLTLIKELGPVLTAIMITGRAGSSMAAEIGVMRISDQIDALEVMDINPMAYLFAPRLAASILCFPLLTALFDVIGIIGGYLTGVAMLGINAGAYFYRVNTSVDVSDISEGFIKALTFGVIVATISCYQGYNTHKRTDSVGPESVSNSTTAAVVLSCVLILVSDYIITSFLL